MPTPWCPCPAVQAAGRPLYRNVFTRGAADGAPFFNPFDLQVRAPAVRECTAHRVLVQYGNYKACPLGSVGVSHCMSPNCQCPQRLLQ